jgi:tRNA G18 (ribose-2'-O)-methylase SpoU
MSQTTNMIIEIDDAGDPRLDLYRNVKDRDLTGREGLFMAEGQVVLERLLQSEICRITSVLTTPERLINLDISALKEEAPVYVVTQTVMDDVAGFAIHRGYLALGKYAPPTSFTDIVTRPRLRILALSAIANTDNMGCRVLRSLIPQGHPGQRRWRVPGAALPDR